MSSSRVLDPEPTMADLIESGRHFYANKNYERALVLFTKALEYRAAIFQALGELDHAMEEAEWILELAPRLPDGYLRVGKIAQLRAKDEYAWKMYTAGIEALKDSSVNSSPKLQQLYDARKPLNRRFFRQDPLYLPAELVTHIFSYLEWTELMFVDLRCLSARLQAMDAHAHESSLLPIMEEDVISEESSSSQQAGVTPRNAEKDVVLGWRWGLEEDPNITTESHSGRLDAATQSITQPGGFGDLEPI
ncbi:uncharacterized protein CPUR_07089 [Claviceps purpurea 20.1]|uniref:Uncharacterized protein n=1 Tax=Claviceps purpurea (strain 20.1) TaxID=1111077 RepID=M1WAQ4_CLAP2|nr:uncharacterized protein CPUR_07089 [Claviceps purpurea 20.1]